MLFVTSIPTAPLLVMVLLNICKYGLSVFDIIKVTIMLYFITAVLIILELSLQIPLPVTEAVGNLILACCLAIFVYTKIRKTTLSCYYSLLVMIIPMISGMILTIFTEALVRTTWSELRNGLVLFLITLIPTFLFSYVISKYIGNKLHLAYMQLTEEIKKRFALYGFVVALLTYLLVYGNAFLYYLIGDRRILSGIEIFLVALIFFVAIIMMANYSLSQQKQMEAVFNSKTEENMTAYTHQLESAYNEMRRFHHDHRNLLSSLLGFIDDDAQTDLRNHIIGAVDYADKALDNLDASMSRLKYIHIPELKGLLAVKFALAQAQGIDVQLDILNPVENIPINRMDLCRLIGIMVDNAIEELHYNEHEKKYIKFGIIVDDTSILIICANPCKAQPLIEDIFQEGYSTRGFGRGIGLSNLKRICVECGNVFYTVRAMDNEFALILTVRREV